MASDLSPTAVSTPNPSLVRPVPVDPARSGRGAGQRTRLSRQQKAAVIVQLLLSEGASLPLGELSETQQEELTTLLGKMRVVDRDTLQSVVAEFVGEMDAIGLTFPLGMEGALGVLDGHISAATSARLRREAGIAARGNPWERIVALPSERLLRVLEEESTEVGAVMLSKLSVARAAEMLGMLSGQRARELSFAISRTGKVRPETVQRIGLSLAAQFDAEPASAFDEGPVERIGAILNFSRAATRDEVLEGLDAADAAFAAEVRRTIFTFSNIPARIAARDVPKILRGVDQPKLVQALGHCAGRTDLEPARDFLLENMSKRMAEALREEIEEAGRIPEAAGEDAANAVVAEIRRLVDSGELELVTEGA